MGNRRRISRRALMASGAASAAAAALGASTLAQAPAVGTTRTFRAWIARGTGRGRTTLQDVRLRPISRRQVLVRTEATNLCYSNVGAVLGLQTTPAAGAGTNPANVGLGAVNANDLALIQGHGGIGIVEA